MSKDNSTDCMSTRISKYLSLILRHKPQTIGIQLDTGGWVDIDTLIQAANRHGQKLDRDVLEKVVQDNDKQRFAISDDGLRIRANQGHSISVDLALTEARPPTSLYHGTVERFLDSIYANGLVPGKRQHVHLSRDVATARAVGARRGRPVILKVSSGKMAQAGHLFYLSENGVWLTEHVPAEFLEIVDGEDG